MTTPRVSPHKPYHFSQHGFSLIEVLIALFVITLLSTLSLTFLNGAMKQTRAAKALHAKLTLREAVKKYYMAKGTGAVYAYEEIKDSGEYSFAYVESDDNLPTYTATPRKADYPTFRVELVFSSGRLRAERECTRGTDADLWKICDEWDGPM